MVIVDERDGADYEGVRIFDGDGDQPVAYQISKGFRTVGVALLGDKTVEASQLSWNREQRRYECEHG